MRAALLVLPAGLALAACERAPSPPRARHVLLISVDTLRADHLGSYGATSTRTPALDALAEEGVRFADCTAPAATTLASHTSLVTGTYPRTHGVPRNGFVLPRELTTLAERLGAAGFWCAAFLGSFALDARFGFDQGFDHFDQRFDIGVGALGADQDQRSSDAVVGATLAHVDLVRARRGFAREGRLFLFVHLFDPHAPYAPPGAASPASLPRLGAAVARRQASALGVAPEAAPGVARTVAEGLTPALAAAPPPEPDAEDRAIAALYAAEVEAVDRAVGRLVLGLEARGLLAETLVVVTADHGETFWEHPNAWNHGLHVHQTDVHVPLIVRMPGEAGRSAPAARVIDTPVSLVDVAPTVLALAAVESPAVSGGAFDGRSLAPALEGGTLTLVPVFAEATQPGPRVEPPEALAGTAWWNAAKPRAARLGPWKLIVAPYLDAEALVHLPSDPDERVDRRDDPDASDVLATLRRVMAEHDTRLPPRAARFDPAQGLETMRRLEALGYFESRR